MYALIICALLATNPQEPVKQHAPAEHKQTHAAPNAQSKTHPLSTTNAPDNQANAASNPAHDKADSSDQTYIIQAAPQSPEPWFKGYVVATFAIAALNFGMLIAIWLQRNIMAGQLTEMQDARNQTDDLIKQATNQTKIAIESHFLSESMVKLEYRAWVQIKENKSTVNQNNHLLDADVTIENTGRTPAKKVHIRLYREEVESGESPSYSYDDGQTMTAQTVIPPKYPLRLDFGENFRVDLDQVDRKNRNLFIHGMVTYDDVFGQHHWTTFCFIFEPDAQTFRAYEEHNETDD
jgi:hypothetical protein